MLGLEKYQELSFGNVQNKNLNFQPRALNIEPMLPATSDCGSSLHAEAVHISSYRWGLAFLVKDRRESVI